VIDGDTSGVIKVRGPRFAFALIAGSALAAACGAGGGPKGVATIVGSGVSSVPSVVTAVGAAAVGLRDEAARVGVGVFAKGTWECGVQRDMDTVKPLRVKVSDSSWELSAPDDPSAVETGTWAISGSRVMIHGGSAFQNFTWDGVSAGTEEVKATNNSGASNPLTISVKDGEIRITRVTIDPNVGSNTPWSAKCKKV
jgi:hypothetical protein